MQDKPTLSLWQKQKNKLMAQFPELTETDFLFTIGKKESMLNNVKDKLGKTTEEFEKLLGNR